MVVLGPLTEAFTWSVPVGVAMSDDAEEGTCRECGEVHVGPHPGERRGGPDRVAEVFDAWADSGRGEGMEEGHLATARPVLEELDVGPGDRFLDLGAGVGWMADHAARLGAESVGVDASGKMMRRARARGGGASFLRASFTALPFRDGVFDAVFSMEALYYAGDVDAALREVHRVTSPGGRVDVLVDYYAENEASHGWPERTGLPMELRSEAAWVESLEAAGFQEVASSRLRAREGSNAEAWKVEAGTLHLVAVR